ncbi:hypothetical protein BS78_02G262300 [Paspalum vaginatum]|nr:hypothetical protein BS78_02G262300 [Paspalum vaginatum]
MILSPPPTPPRRPAPTPRGDEVCVFFQLHEPPQPSRIYLSWPAGKGVCDRFIVVGAHRDVVLFRMMYPIPVPGSDFDRDMHDYILYTAGDGSRGPSLHLLPSLHCTTAEFRGMLEAGRFRYSNQLLRRLVGLDIDVLRRGDVYALAELQIDRFAKAQAELHVLCSSRSDRWQVTHPDIIIHDSGLDMETFLFKWSADSVVPIGNYLCWVDYCLGGILLCNVFDDSSGLRYVPLLAKIPGMNREIHGKSWSDMYQTVGVVNEDHGVLKFVMVLQGDAQNLWLLLVSSFLPSAWLIQASYVLC